MFLNMLGGGRSGGWERSTGVFLMFNSLCTVLMSVGFLLAYGTIKVGMTRKHLAGSDSTGLVPN